MKPHLVLITHGLFAQQLHESAKMVMGEIEGLHTIAMLESDGLSGTRTKLKTLLDEIGAENPVVIAADMFCGTPCNVAVETIYQRENIRVITGLNMPMLIEYAVSEIEDLDEMAAFLVETGISAIKIVEKPVIDTEEGGYED